MKYRVLRPLGFAVLMGTCLCGPSSRGAEDVPVQDAGRLVKFCGQVQRGLASRLQALADTAQVLFGVLPDSKEARWVLNNWSNERLEWAAIALLDTDGQVVAHKRHGGTARWVAGEFGNELSTRKRLKVGQPTTHVLSLEGESGMWFRTLFPLFHEDGVWSGAVSLTYRFDSVFSQAAQVLSLRDDERSLAITREGRVLIAAPQNTDRRVSDTYLALSERPSRRVLFERMRDESAGVGSYPALSEEPPETVVQSVEWVQCEFMNARWILVVEAQEDLLQDPENPITGRWVGAYTIKGARQAGRELEGEMFPRGGQLNVVILQDGYSCTLRAIGGEGDHIANGVAIGDRFSAADIELSRHGKVAVWYWEGVYDPGKDTIKGSIRGNAADVATTQSFFLRRVSSPTRTAVDDTLSEERPSAQ